MKKRSAPEPVEPVSIDNVRYEGLHWGKNRGLGQNGGYIVAIDAAILTNPKVWEASGHLATFTDPLIDCRKCNERWRADQIGDTCPNCGSKDLTEARPFNLMFKTFVGPVEDEASVAYLRPETAQGMFVNFANVQTTMRRKPPFGIAQLGRSFRNHWLRSDRSRAVLLRHFDGTWLAQLLAKPILAEFANLNAGPNFSWAVEKEQLAA